MSSATELLDTVQQALPQLTALTDDASLRPIAPGKWSPRQIIGHLIDSAINNDRRFVIAQLQDDLILPGYAQDDWVRVQQYETVSWIDLVDTWRALNLHLAHVMAAASDDARTRPRLTHNLHEIGFRTFAREAAVSLGDLMDDYVQHLRHHLRQILGTFD